MEKSLFNKIMNDNYLPTFDELVGKSFCSNFSVMSKLIEKDYHYIEYYTGKDIQIFLLALEKGFIPTIEFINQHDFIQYNMDFMTLLYNKHPNYLQELTGASKMCMLLTAIDNDYVPSEEEFYFLLSDEFDQNDDIRNIRHSLFFSKSFMEKMIKQNPRNILYSEAKDTDLFSLALTLGYSPSIEELKNRRFYYIFLDEDIIRRLIEINPDFISLYRGRNEEVFLYAVNNGYIPDREKLNTSIYEGQAINHSVEIMKKAISINPDLVIYYTGNFEYIFSLALEKGFVPNDEILAEADSRLLPILKNKFIMCKAIDYNPNNVLYYLGSDNEVFQRALEKGYIPSFYDFETCHNIRSSVDMFNVYLINNNYFDDNPFFKWFFNSKYNCSMNYEDFCKIDNFISFSDVFKIYTYEETAFICKYFVLSRENDRKTGVFFKAIKAGKLKCIDKFIKLMVDVKSCKKDYIIFLEKIIYNYNFYSKLIDDVVNNWPISITQKFFLMHLLENDFENLVQINSLKELDDEHNRMLDKMKNDIETNIFYRKIDVLKDMIYHLLCNSNYSKFEKLGYTSSSLMLLRENIHDLGEKEELSRYILFLNFLEIFNKMNEEDLKDACLRIIDYVKKNESICIVYSTIEKMQKRLKEIVAKELQGSILNFASLDYGDYEEDGYRKIKNRYVVSNVTIHGETLKECGVDYIELCGLDYTSLVHVMNAYGEGGSLKDFKCPRFVGKTYICLTGIYNEKVNNVTDIDTRIKKNIDNVTLLFSHFDIDQFVMESSHDLYSMGSFNSLLIENDTRPCFLPIRFLVDNSTIDQVSEVVLYRENDIGKYLYPSAILIRNQVPTDDEIYAAAYLGIPIVYVNQLKYKRKSGYIIESYSPKKDEYIILREKLEELKTLLQNEKGKRI